MDYDVPAETATDSGRVRAPLLYLNVLVIAVCGLVYELVAGTLASYLLGDSVTQFSLCIGIYLSAMGVGAWLSGFLERQLARYFIEVELGVALIGGLSAPILFIAYGYINDAYFYPLLYGLVFSIGTLVGLELPLLMRLLSEQLEFRELVARVLTFDYIGALVGSLLFPILLVPRLGLIRTSLLFGMLNACVGLWGTWLLAPILKVHPVWLRLRAVLVLVLLGSAFIYAERLTALSEQKIYADPIVHAVQTKYQRIIVTKSPERFQLFLDGKLQFNSHDEYRYHEALVHPAMLTAGQPQKVLVLGGGDGLGLREILKYPSVTSVKLVDLDPQMTGLSDAFPALAELNEHAFDDPRVQVINTDAMIWLADDETRFDVVIIDFPDPNNFALGKLYTTRFYNLLKQRLNPDAAVGIQCTSPLFSRNAFWCIQQTLEAAGFLTNPYHVPVPSFGVWGFSLATLKPVSQPTVIPESFACKFLNDSILAGMFVFPNDLDRVDTEINRLDNQALVRYYERY